MPRYCSSEVIMKKRGLILLKKEKNQAESGGVSLVPYSRKPVIKNKKSGECIKIRNLKIAPRHLSRLIFPFTGVSSITPQWGPLQDYRWGTPNRKRHLRKNIGRAFFILILQRNVLSTIWLHHALVKNTVTSPS